MSDEFPTQSGSELVTDDTRPGEPLHPGTNTIVDRGNHPLKEGENIHVYYKDWADGHGKELLRADLVVIGDDGEGDIFAIPADQEPDNAERVYRLTAGMDRIVSATIVSRPSYDDETGEYTVTREVKRRGQDFREVVEARTLGTTCYYDNSGGRL